MRLSAVAPDALLEVALSIQQALCDVLAHHSLLENAYRQHIAGLEDELASASQRADALQSLAGASDAAAARLEHRVDQLTGLLRDQQLQTDRLTSAYQDFQLRQLPSLAPAQSPIPVSCILHPGAPDRADASPYQWTSPSTSPEGRRLGRGSPVLPASRHSGGAPALGPSGGAALVDELNALQHRFVAAPRTVNHSREHAIQLSAYAHACHDAFYVQPAAVPVGAPRMPGPKVPSRSVDKIIGFEKGCVKLIVSAADAGFVTKSVRFFEAFESKLRPWGVAELFGLLLTRRVRVVVDSGGSTGDFSRIMQMLQASSQPYAGLNRLCPFWLIATRDLDRRGVVYVDASVLIELDAVLLHILVTYADDAAQQRVLGKCAPSDSAYVAWLALCNYPFAGPGFSETALRQTSQAYLDTLKWDSKKSTFTVWEQDLCAAIRSYHLPFPSDRFRNPLSYVDYLWHQVGPDRTRQHRPQVELQYDASSYQNEQLVLLEADLPRYIDRMARALKDSDPHPGTGVSVNNVKIDVAAIMSQLKQLKQSVGAAAVRPTGAVVAAACPHCKLTPCRGVCTNCLMCRHTLAQCDYPGGPKHDPVQHAGKSKSAPEDVCQRCRGKGHFAHSCFKLKLPDIKSRVFEGLSSADARSLAIERAKGGPQQAKGSTARRNGVHSVGARDGATGGVRREFLKNPSRTLTKRLNAVMASCAAVEATPPAPAPSPGKQQSQHEIDLEYVRSLEAQFARHSAQAIGAVIVVGADAAMGAVPRPPPYFGSTIVEVGMSMPQTNTDLVRSAMRRGTYYMLDGGSPIHLMPPVHALQGWSQIVRGTLRQSSVRAKGFLPDSAVTLPLLCGEVSLKFYESLSGGIHSEKVLCFFCNEIDFNLYSELSLVHNLGFSVLECSDPEHLPAWTTGHAAKFSTGNRFLVKRTPSGYVALEHTPAGDHKYKGTHSISPSDPDYSLFRQLCSAHVEGDLLEKLPCQHVSLEQQRAFYAAAPEPAHSDPLSVSSVLFPDVDHSVGPLQSALHQLAMDTAAEHRAGADELSVAALTLAQSGLSSVSDLRVPDSLVPTVVCSRCEQPGCSADVCQRPCRLCAKARGHEQSCLRLHFLDTTITRFLSTADAADDFSDIGVQAVYPTAVRPSDAPEVSGAAAPTLSTEGLELLRRVRPDLLARLSSAQNVPRTANGTPLPLVFDELPLGQRFELCRLFDRSRDLRHESAIRDSAQAAFAKLCEVCAADLDAST